jgi:DNA-directed RNA polymerase subunit RPC12/RpoP
MDALKLYSLKTLPQFEPAVKKRPAKRPKLQIVKKNTIQYICDSCSNPVFLANNDLVQCDSCDNRIVSKTANSKPRTYEAV